jgi:GntR family transcriptional regulator of arabinose operon
MAQKRGIEIPEDLSVVSIDNSNLADICPVPFTSCFHPKEKLGIKAAENLLKMIEDPAYDGNYVFTSMPFYRESVRALI